MLLAQLEYSLDNSIMTQRTLHLRIGAADVALASDRVAAKLRKQQAVPGFRKGKAPLRLVRNRWWDSIRAEVFQELQRAALEQVFQKLDNADKPLIPPEVLDEKDIRLRYGYELEFAVKYLIDPSGISRNPQQPEFQQGTVVPGATVNQQPATVPGLPLPPPLPRLPQ